MKAAATPAAAPMVTSSRRSTSFLSGRRKASSNVPGGPPREERWCYIEILCHDVGETSREEGADGCADMHHRTLLPDHKTARHREHEPNHLDPIRVRCVCVGLGLHPTLVNSVLMLNH